jgi:tetratricopeptide (TPR) repeat protein
VAIEVSTWRVSDFLGQMEESFGVQLEYGRYCLEKDDLRRGVAILDKAEKLALDERHTRKFLEVQILKCLMSLYRQDLRTFGQTLLKIKPLLGEATYASFLGMYNQGLQASSTHDLNRLIGGIALGAEHYAVAARILGEVAGASPNDPLAARLLAEAQLQLRDFPAAEKTLLNLTRLNANQAETHINLARFYLTARYLPAAAQTALDNALALDPQDSRVALLGAMLDFCEGRVPEGLRRLEEARRQGTDPRFNEVCDRLLRDGRELAKASTADRLVFVRRFALPGSQFAPADSMRLLGEEYLKRGSYFEAMKCFLAVRDLAEIGRTWLGLSSHLFANGEDKSAALAAGFGLRALKEELQARPDSSRGHLYLSLYHLDRGEEEMARTHARRGLSGSVDSPETRRRLSAVLTKVSS